MMKSIGNISVWVILSSLVLICAGWGMHSSYELREVEISLKSDTHDEAALVNEEYIRDYIYDRLGVDLHLLSSAERELLVNLEQILDENPFVEKAKVFEGQSGSLHLHINTKQPIARVIDATGKNYYITNKQDIVPFSYSYSPRVMVLTGYVPQVNEEGWQGILDLSLTIHEDEFLRPLIESIRIDKEQKFYLVPKVGNFNIRLGELKDVDEKIDKLKTFYKSTYDKINWAMYRSIHLDFKNQIVLKKKNNRT
ncbi:MAG TPA: hypothetical protein VJ917_00220 [Saprospiraceae bacterium]|nr:hypothetical protein [Saprospiraceae bacterium]